MATNKNMIAVIADDFTGAAEIGGVGLRRGLKVLIETSVSGAIDVDLLVIATDTRSMNTEDARKEVEKVTRKLRELKPGFIFKKIDSVLRGNVMEELLALQSVMGKDRIICVPANPHFGRIIKNGTYYVNGIPLAETSFASDPQYPARSSKVSEILGKNDLEIQCVNISEVIPEKGFIIGNVETMEETQKWADLRDEKTIFAGGSGFFDAFLTQEFPNLIMPIDGYSMKTGNSMFVFGSAFIKDEISSIYTSEFQLEADLFSDSVSNEKISELALQISAQIEQKHSVSISTKNLEQGLFSPEKVRKSTAQLVGEVMKCTEINKLYIEGGATTYSILSNLQVAQLIPVKEINFGIIEMLVPQIPGLKLITKPGSYTWPDQLF